jgi:hypothetical protein
MFFAVVLAALVIGAGMVSIPLLLLLPRFYKSTSAPIDVDQLIRALLQDRNLATSTGAPTANTKPAPQPAPPRPAAAKLPAPRKPAANPEEELLRNILEDNLKIRGEIAGEQGSPGPVKD